MSVVAADGRWHARAGGSDLWLENETFLPVASASGSSAAMELKAPFNGKVVALKVVAGQSVCRGDTLVVLESMKLEHSLAAPRDAVVAALAVSVGQQAGPGQVLVRFAP